MKDNKNRKKKMATPSLKKVLVPPASYLPKARQKPLCYEDSPQTEQRQGKTLEPVFQYDIPSSYPDCLLTVSPMHYRLHNFKYANKYCTAIPI